MVTKIYSGDEARALLADHDAPPRITYGDLCGLGVPLCVDGREMEWREDGDGDGDWICVPEGEAAMHTAAPDLAASVVHHANRADAAEAACARLRRRITEIEARLPALRSASSRYGAPALDSGDVKIYSGAEARVLREVATLGEDDAARLAAAAYDLAASVEHHAARADAAQAACVQLRLAVDALCEADALAEQERTRMRARIAELERLATGPRSAESDDAGLSRPFAPETLPGWDGDGREVSR